MSSSTISSAVEDFARSLKPGSEIVDVGCGLQPYRHFFLHTLYIGIDVEDSGRNAEDKCADKYFDGIKIPLESESFDAVLCTEVLEHAVDPELLVAEIFRILRPGGRLCVTVPFMWGLHELPYDFRRFTSFGLAKLVSGCGFEIDRQENINVGARAVRTLIDSEVNNFLVNVAPFRKSSPIARQQLRIKVAIHELMLRALDRMWQSTFCFERVYIDNLLLAHKRAFSSNMHNAGLDVNQGSL